MEKYGVWVKVIQAAGCRKWRKSHKHTSITSLTKFNTSCNAAMPNNHSQQLLTMSSTVKVLLELLSNSW